MSGEQENPTDGSEQGGGSCRVFVGNLSWRTSWQNLKDHMREAGQVRFADVFYERASQGRRPRSKGCGVVEFETAEEAQKAIDELNETDLDGRKIFVQADNRPDQNGRGGGGGARNVKRATAGGPKGKPVGAKKKSPGGDPKRVYVGNLAWETSWQTLKDHMRKAGEVSFVDLFETYNGRSRGCALVEFSTVDDAQKAIKELNDTELDGRKIFVREDREKKDGQGGGNQGGKKKQEEDAESDASGPDDDGIKCYVGNLSYSAKDSDLEGLFAEFGCRKAEIKMTKNGRSKGFGIVTFDSQDNAESVIKKYHDTEFQGRHITVREDRKGGSKKANTSKVAL